jgi:hypothetical protein
MTRALMLAQPQIGRNSRPSMWAKARSAAEPHPGYEPSGSNANAEYGASNPRFN